MKELVQVQATYNKVDEQLLGTWDQFTDSYLFAWTDGFIPIDECVSDEMVVIKPFVLFDATPINTTNDYEAFLDYELSNIGSTALTADDDEVIEQIKLIADQYRHDDCSNFILVYNISFPCSCGGSGWSCDCDSEIELVGLLDIKNLPILPLPKVAT